LYSCSVNDLTVSSFVVITVSGTPLLWVDSYDVM
jgi:hypothetical protein